ncbi:MAG: hypothetical protein AAFP04_12925 [Myxococcota bacterium]
MSNAIQGTKSAASQESSWLDAIGRSLNDAADAVGEQVGAAVDAASDFAKDSVETAAEATGVNTAIDYWSKHSPRQVTANFRHATDQYATDRFGPTAGKLARLASVPVGAAARFGVQVVQGADHVATQSTKVIRGEAPLPSPTKLAGDVALGVVNYAGTTLDAGVKSVYDGAAAIARGDLEGAAAAAEDGLKATLDVVTLAAGAQGVAGGLTRLSTGSTAAASAGGGAAALQAAFSVGNVVAGGVQVGGSLGGLAALNPRTPRPIESRGRGETSSARSKSNSTESTKGMRESGLAKLKELGLENVQLAGRSFNSGRKALEKAGFEWTKTTPSGRRVFSNSKTGAKVSYDSGKALSPGQKPHWHIDDRGGFRYSRSGRRVLHSAPAAHIPAN